MGRYKHVDCETVANMDLLIYQTSCTSEHSCRLRYANPPGKVKSASLEVGSARWSLERDSQHLIPTSECSHVLNGLFSDDDSGRHNGRTA